MAAGSIAQVTGAANDTDLCRWPLSLAGLAGHEDGPKFKGMRRACNRSSRFPRPPVEIGDAVRRRSECEPRPSSEGSKC